MYFLLGRYFFDPPCRIWRILNHCFTMSVCYTFLSAGTGSSFTPCLLHLFLGIDHQSQDSPAIPSPNDWTIYRIPKRPRWWWHHHLGCWKSFKSHRSWDMKSRLSLSNTSPVFVGPSLDLMFIVSQSYFWYVQFHVLSTKKEIIESTSSPIYWLVFSEIFVSNIKNQRFLNGLLGSASHLVV